MEEIDPKGTPSQMTPEMKCLYCERSSEEVPLITIHYRDQITWICPEHLPILIHKPEQLADRLPGAQNPEAHAGQE
jgi:hypothetical protein